MPIPIDFWDAYNHLRANPEPFKQSDGKTLQTDRYTSRSVQLERIIYEFNKQLTKKLCNAHTQTAKVKPISANFAVIIGKFWKDPNMTSNKKNTSRQEDVYKESLADVNRAVKQAEFIKKTNDMIMDAIFGRQNDT